MNNKRPKIVITDCDHPSVEIEKKILSEIEPELILETCRTEEDIIAVAADADGIINQYGVRGPHLLPRGGGAGRPEGAARRRRGLRGRGRPPRRHDPVTDGVRPRREPTAGQGPARPRALAYARAGHAE